MLASRVLFLLLCCAGWSASQASTATEFCLDGELDLGARYQGTKPASGEFSPTTWCVITEDATGRVWFSAAGKSNPDMEDNWTVAYLPPDLVRIINRNAPPDIEFHGTDNSAQARRIRRLDPRRLLQEFRSTPANLNNLQLEIRDGKVMSVRTTADLPLRGRVNVVWRWNWRDPHRPTMNLIVDGTVLYRATGRWRDLANPEATKLWQPTPDHDPVQVPGDRWPARINMKLLQLADGVALVRGVRTGFQHLVVDTDEGLVIADAPAGWVEFHHLPPADLVPTDGVSGLSEKLIDFLQEAFPDRPIRAVALTHFHDDHAGGARAFAAAGAEIFATRQTTRFLKRALNRTNMPRDRLSGLQQRVKVTAVKKTITIGSTNSVRLIPMGRNPHVNAMLGVLTVAQNYFFVSDVHVPRSEADEPTSVRARTECWFADWATRNLPPDTRVINSHSSPETPLSRLQLYQRSPVCQAQ